AAKASRTFEQLPQHGWRCSLTGESEWLTTDPAQLSIPAGQRKAASDNGFRNGQQHETLWTKVAEKRPSWAKKGEHLGGLSALKRLWPTLFAEQVSQATGKDCGRFVVSTHTMALAKHLDNWLANDAPADQTFSKICETLKPDSVALPRGLLRKHGGKKNHLQDAKVLPGLLDAARDSENDRAYEQALQVVKRTLGVATPETYYSLIMLDGDRMGAILAGDTTTKTAISYRASFHPNVHTSFDAQAANNRALKNYSQQARAISPNRHLAISGALNDFSQTVVPHVVEAEHLGRVLYAGGDDVLAMLPTADLLSTMQRLRHAYSGAAPQDDKTNWGMVRNRQGDVRNKLVLNKGFAWLNGRLMRMMGRHATASCGAIVAHHQAPLGAVLQELRKAEQRAKGEGERDAFSITIIKRSGGALYLTEKWGEPLNLLQDLIDYLRTEGTSRRAVYNSLEWLRDLPEPNSQRDTDMLASLLAYQLKRQAKGEAQNSASHLAERLAKLCAAQKANANANANANTNTDSMPSGNGKSALNWLANFMGVAEFLARETRNGETNPSTSNQPVEASV
ncbi:MAG: type III-B CRISPR-associated protein Cas10/Cmr2, partial [Rhodoferax sp.]|nr:type III-B CRISPR-associated protein Cas10/Cmr2 [Rhodoferax sp.]